MSYPLFLDGGDGWKLYAAAPSEKPAYLLNVSGNNGGSVSGGGNYEHGTSAPICDSKSGLQF